jgi:hypothetical protein
VENVDSSFVTKPDNSICCQQRKNAEKKCRIKATEKQTLVAINLPIKERLELLYQ